MSRERIPDRSPRGKVCRREIAVCFFSSVFPEQSDEEAMERMEGVDRFGIH